MEKTMPSIDTTIRFSRNDFGVEKIEYTHHGKTWTAEGPIPAAMQVALKFVSREAQ